MKQLRNETNESRTEEPRPVCSLLPTTAWGTPEQNLENWRYQYTHWPDNMPACTSQAKWFFPSIMVLLFPSLVCMTFGKKIKITKYRPFLTSMATKIPTSVGSCASLKSQGVLSPQASWRQQFHCPGENKTPSFDKCQTEKLSQVCSWLGVGRDLMKPWP